MTAPPDGRLLVISFTDRVRAQEFLLVAARLEKNDLIKVLDAVILDRDAQGNTRVTETLDVTPGRGALGAGFWGLLLGTLLAGPWGLVVGAASAGGGALVAKLRDIGIKDEKIEELRREVPPGRTALALLVDQVSMGDLQRELVRFPNASLVETDLPPAAITAVQYALAEANRDPFSAAAGAAAPPSASSGEPSPGPTPDPSGQP